MKIDDFSEKLKKRMTITDYNILLHFFSFKNYIKNDILTNDGIKLIKKILKSKRPLSQITGRRFFFENWFIVNKKVLIPRFETEVIIENFIEENLNNKIIFDICCGTGCLGISAFLKNKNSNLYLSDISKSAIRCTKKNLKEFKINASVLRGNFFQPFIKKNLKADFVIINPPYILKGDVNVEKNVNKYEPKIALYAKQEGLEFFYKIKKDYKKILKPNGKIYCEFGFKQKEKLEQIFINENIEYYKDYSGNWRWFVLSNLT
ncbi:HemK family protein methyltransferase [Spiroplasma endosymbiont of Crioceris asparagi]|uniref:HemK family protein methyltransferase n=1 Tax=Spiroplasma endosymbiont of Crioceris asparagi TaxID=3066286 RepID=UPI0030CABA39